MAKGSSKKESPKPQGINRKRVEAESTLKRARDGSAFTKCEACGKNVSVVLIDMHSCSLDSKIRMTLEAQVVEKVVEAKKPAERKRAAPSGEKKEKSEKSSKKLKKSKDPSKPKRPPTAFFLFMEDFRKTFKEENPDNKSVAVVAKEGGEKWKSLSDEEKKQYVERAAELKAEYEKAKNDAEKGGDDEENEKKEVEVEEEQEEVKDEAVDEDEVEEEKDEE